MNIHSPGIIDQQLARILHQNVTSLQPRIGFFGNASSSYLDSRQPYNLPQLLPLNRTCEATRNMPLNYFPPIFSRLQNATLSSPIIPGRFAETSALETLLRHQSTRDQFQSAHMNQFDANLPAQSIASTPTTIPRLISCTHEIQSSAENTRNRNSRIMSTNHSNAVPARSDDWSAQLHEYESFISSSLLSRHSSQSHNFEIFRGSSPVSRGYNHTRQRYNSLQPFPIGTDPMIDAASGETQVNTGRRLDDFNPDCDRKRSTESTTQSQKRKFQS
jgi:hypothetical protein